MEHAIDIAVVIGIVNAVTFFVPNLGSRAKVGIALVAAVVLTYAPFNPNVAGIIDLVFGSSGLYKSLQVVGAVKRVA